MIKTIHLSANKQNNASVALAKVAVCTAFTFAAFIGGNFIYSPQTLAIVSQPAVAEAQEDPLVKKCETWNWNEHETLEDVAKKMNTADLSFTMDQLLNQKIYDQNTKTLCAWLPKSKLNPAENSSQTTENYSGSISNIFTPQVLSWENEILRWYIQYGKSSEGYEASPNLIATVMRIESNGNKNAISKAGALGLFQVMPYHFKEGEKSFDPDTNARVGLKILAECLDQADDKIGPALACYNGGPYAADWLLGNLSRQDYVDYIDSLWGVGEGELKAQQVERYVDRGVSIYNQALSNSP
jgi:hypothetical protein